MEKMPDEMREKVIKILSNSPLRVFPYDVLKLDDLINQILQLMDEEREKARKKIVGEKIFTHKEPTEDWGRPEILDEEGKSHADIADWVERFYEFDTGDKFRLILTKL